MALKSYEELIKVDVRQYCEERDGFTYLNWAKCIELLRQNGATEVYWEPIPDPQTGSSLRKTDIEFKDKNNNTNRCYETRIKVVIDDKEYEMQTPVMNGANPVKDNSMSQQRVWNSMCRAFVKCVAIHTGLGFNLWLKEEYNKLEAKIPGTGENLASEAKKKTLKTQCTAHGIFYQESIKISVDDDAAGNIKNMWNSWISTMIRTITMRSCRRSVAFTAKDTRCIT